MLRALTADTVHGRGSIKMPWASLAAEKKRKYTLKWWITLTEGCSNFFWHISLNSDLVRPVLASHPAMANSICRAYSSQPCFLSCFLSPASAECGRREVSRPGRFDVFLRKKSAFHKHPRLFQTALIRRSIGECDTLMPVSPLGGCHGGALLVIHSDTWQVFWEPTEDCVHTQFSHILFVRLGETVT